MDSPSLKINSYKFQLCHAFSLDEFDLAIGRILFLCTNNEGGIVAEIMRSKTEEVKVIHCVKYGHLLISDFLCVSSSLTLNFRYHLEIEIRMISEI